MSETKVLCPVTSLLEARVLVDLAIQRLPTLTTYGVGVYFEVYRQGREAVARALAEGQAALYDDSCLRMVAWCTDWLKLRRTRKTFNPYCTSYGYKHVVENACGDYISNGCFIAAALGLGLDFKIDGPNAIFKISDKRLPGVSDVR